MTTTAKINKTFKNELKNIYPEREIKVFVEILLEHYAGLNKTDLILKAGDKLDDTVAEQLRTALEQLKRNEPIQYIIGETEFYGLRIKVNTSVLIPRPETEELVHRIIGNHKKDGKIKILDIGTGSGCIALALKNKLPGAEVFGVDVSDKALETAQTNAELNNLDVRFSNLDILKGKTNRSLGEFDIIISNPPYVRQKEKELMHKNVLENEPHLALFVDDDDALVFYRAIVYFSAKYLKNQGFIYFEINEALGKAVENLLASNNFSDIELFKDLSGKERMVKAIKN